MVFKYKTEEELKEYFVDLQFDEASHTYTFKGIKISKSVSGKIKSFYEPFDAEKIAPFSAKKLGITTEEVLAMWAEKAKVANERGTKIHLFAELHQVDRTISPSSPEEEAIAKFFRKMPKRYIPVAKELRMVHFTDLFAGTLDMLMWDSLTETYVIVDWKTNQDLYKNYKGKKMLAPFRHLLDCSLSKYKLQLSYYQNLLQQIPGVIVSRRIIVWVKPDGTYEMLDCEDYTKELEEKW